MKRFKDLLGILIEKNIDPGVNEPNNDPPSTTNQSEPLNPSFYPDPPQGSGFDDFDFINTNEVYSDDNGNIFSFNHEIMGYIDHGNGFGQFFFYENGQWFALKRIVPIPEGLQGYIPSSERLNIIIPFVPYPFGANGGMQIDLGGLLFGFNTPTGYQYFIIQPNGMVFQVNPNGTLSIADNFNILNNMPEGWSVAAVDTLYALTSSDGTIRIPNPHITGPNFGKRFNVPSNAFTPIGRPRPPRLPRPGL